jgi:hypothetical protein
MASTYSTSLKIELMGTGDQNGAWGATTNTNLGTAVEQAIVGMATLTSGDFTSNTATLTLTNTPALQNARAYVISVPSAAVSADSTVLVPAIQKPYILFNGSLYTVTIKVSALTGVAVPAGKKAIVYNDGTDITTAISYIPSLTLGAALPVASGGTGGTTFTGVLVGNGASAMTTVAAPSGTIVGTTDTQTLTNKTLTSPAISAPTFTGSSLVNGVIRGNTNAVTSGAVDCSLGNYFTTTVSGNTTFVFSNIPAGAYSFTIQLLYSAPGGWTLTWPAAVKWANGITPAPNSNTYALIMFTTADSGSTLFGAYLQNFA